VHKQAHDEYLEEFDALLDAWRKSNDIVPVAAFLEDATPVWLEQHIASMDFVTANFFAMHEGS